MPGATDYTIEELSEMLVDQILKEQFLSKENLRPKIAAFIDALPEIGTTCLVYSTQGGFTVAKFTNWNSSYGYHWDEAWFVKNGRQMSRKTIVAWVGLKTE